MAKAKKAIPADTVAMGRSIETSELIPGHYINA
jgi:hypothetical protein